MINMKDSNVTNFKSQNDHLSLKRKFNELT